MHPLFLLVVVCTFGKGLAQCGTVHESGVTPTEIETIVNVHNKFRQGIASGTEKNQPKASNMLKMAWDDNLAALAQQLADTCNFEHITQSDPRFGEVGQNLYLHWSTDLRPGGCNWTRATQAWYNEQISYSFSNDDFNHYTQLVWAGTYLVGCGYKYYTASDGTYQKLCACNYAPAGNYVGEFPYELGDGCEDLCLPP